MSLQTLSDYVVYSKYAQFLPDKKRRETWSEIIDRVFDMHAVKYAKELAENRDFYEEFHCVKQIVKDKKAVGSQRALQWASPNTDEGIFKHNIRLYNCSSVLVDRPRVFQEIGYALLAGCGVGYSVQKHHVESLPNLINPDAHNKTYTPDDTIEGWCECWGILINSFFKGGIYPEYEGYHVNFDLSKIRKEGSLIAGKFKAPGPKPLEKSLKLIRSVLQESCTRGRLTPIQCHDIICHIADAIISGGVRRSALISLFSKDDSEMATAKIGDWGSKNPQRARANNSVVLERGKVTKEEFDGLFENIKHYGEPGFYFIDDGAIHQGCNPCFSIDTKILTPDGWRTFRDLLGTNEFPIIQDKRIQGRLSNSEEIWEIDLNQKGVTTNIASNARLTSVNQKVFKLTLECGREVIATENHHFATTRGMIELKDLNKKDKVLIPIPGDPFESEKNSDDYKLGFLVGLHFGDGTETKKDKELGIDIWGDTDMVERVTEDANALLNKASESLCFRTNAKLPISFSKSDKSEAIGKYDKYRLSSSLLKQLFVLNGVDSKHSDSYWLHNKSKNFKSGFISGIFYADGHTEYSDAKKCLSIRLSSVNIDLLRDIQLILQELGSFSKIKDLFPECDRLLPDSSRNPKLYHCKKSYRLIIGGFQNCLNTLKFLELKGKDLERVKYVSDKTFKIYNIETHSKIKSIEFDSIQNVYCLTEESRRTLIANGMTARRCCEIGFWLKTLEGESGFGGCNLSEINGGMCKTREDFLIAARAASFIGTLQAGYTNFPYLGEISEQLFRHEALLGVSITGWMDNPSTLFNEETLREGVKEVKETNERIAKIIGINPSARLTTTKPSGSASSVLMTGSGIHPHHSKKFLRRVQVNKKEFAGKVYKKKNPRAVAESVWSANKSDNVISFPCEMAGGVLLKRDFDAIQFLEKVKFAYQNWVVPGTVRDRGLDSRVTHNISCSVYVKNDWDEVRDYLYENRGCFTGVSFISSSGDLDYDQAPFVEVLDEKELVERYGSGVVLASGLIVDGLHAFDNLWVACDCVLGNGEAFLERDEPAEPKKPSKRKFKTQKELTNALADYAIQLNLYYQDLGDYNTLQSKQDWVRRAKQFAERYFNGDLRLMTYCLKHVHIFKEWLDINRTHKDIDWANIKEDSQEFVDADTLAATACSGGNCETKI